MGSLFTPQPPSLPLTSPLPAAARQGRFLSPSAASRSRSSPPAAAAAQRRAPPGTATERRAPGTALPTASSGGANGGQCGRRARRKAERLAARRWVTLYLSARPAHLLIPLPPPVRSHTVLPSSFFFFNSSFAWVGFGYSFILQRTGLERGDAGTGRGSQAALGGGGIQLPPTPTPQPCAGAAPTPHGAAPKSPAVELSEPDAVRAAVGWGHAAGELTTHRPLPVISAFNTPPPPHPTPPPPGAAPQLFCLPPLAVRPGVGRGDVNEAALSRFPPPYADTL